MIVSTDKKTLDLVAPAVGACPGRKEELCGQIECAAKADFLLLLDSSGSMSTCDWQSQGWFAKEFVSRLPSTGGQFDHAQVSVIQFSSDTNIDQALTTSRADVLNVLDCDRCTSSGGTNGGQCNYKMQSGGTSTVLGMMGAIGELSKGKRIFPLLSHFCRGFSISPFISILFLFLSHHYYYFSPCTCGCAQSHHFGDGRWTQRNGGTASSHVLVVSRTRS